MKISTLSQGYTEIRRDVGTFETQYRYDKPSPMSHSTLLRRKQGLWFYTA